MLRDKLFIFLLLFVCAVSVECKICQSLDIRNKVSDLNRLRNCTEIVGFLRILLIERVKSENDFDQYVFPDLREIKGYLFFYRVLYLTSVGKMFPNLMIIRGTELFTDYSLVIYNMPHLREVNVVIFVSSDVDLWYFTALFVSMKQTWLQN